MFNMETIYINDMVDLLPIGDPDRIYLINEQAKGLDWSTHVTVERSLSKDKKIEIIREVLNHFKNVDDPEKFTRITNL